MIFTKTELAFLEKGGQIYAARAQSDNKWEIVKFNKNGEWIPPDSIQNSKENAEETICMLANLADDLDLIAVHHSIKRPDDWPDWYLIAK